MIQTLTNNHKEIVLATLESSEKELKIVSPFLSMSLAKILCNIVKNGIKCTFITRLYIQDIVCKANSLEAMELMISSGIDLYAVKGLHTKLYLADRNKAILGSANFTISGLTINHELSLLFEKEEIIPDFHAYFDDLLDKAEYADGRVTKTMLDDADKDLTLLFGDKKHSGKADSSKMYGADIGLLLKKLPPEKLRKETMSGETESHDTITEMFRDVDDANQIMLDHTVWMKFTGKGDDRHPGDEKASIFSVPTANGRTYLATYPWKPSQVRDGDEIYIAPLTTDNRGNNQPVIVGRGKLKAFSESNYAKDEWFKKVSWLTDYPWYCVIEECELLDTEIENGVPLDAVLNHLGSNTYISSYGKKESPSDVEKKHHQKAHIRLSGNAKEYVDKRFDVLVAKYGSHIVKSDD